VDRDCSADQLRPSGLHSDGVCRSRRVRGLRAKFPSLERWIGERQEGSSGLGSCDDSTVGPSALLTEACSGDDARGRSLSPKHAANSAPKFGMVRPSASASAASAAAASSPVLPDDSMFGAKAMASSDLDDSLDSIDPGTSAFYKAINLPDRGAEKGHQGRVQIGVPRVRRSAAHGACRAPAPCRTHRGRRQTSRAGARGDR
jgi:hypothetical protein